MRAYVGMYVDRYTLTVCIHIYIYIYIKGEREREKFTCACIYAICSDLTRTAHKPYKNYETGMITAHHTSTSSSGCANSGSMRDPQETKLSQLTPNVGQLVDQLGPKARSHI